jgi:hypothetical protein
MQRSKFLKTAGGVGLIAMIDSHAFTGSKSPDSICVLFTQNLDISACRYKFAYK